MKLELEPLGSLIRLLLIDALPPRATVTLLVVPFRFLLEDDRVTVESALALTLNIANMAVTTNEEKYLVINRLFV